MRLGLYFGLGEERGSWRDNSSDGGAGVEMNIPKGTHVLHLPQAGRTSSVFKRMTCYSHLHRYHPEALVKRRFHSADLGVGTEGQRLCI